jgi:hypothetical protein
MVSCAKVSGQQFVQAYAAQHAIRYPQRHTVSFDVGWWMASPVYDGNISGGYELCKCKAPSADAEDADNELPVWGVPWRHCGISASICGC